MPIISQKNGSILLYDANTLRGCCCYGDVPDYPDNRRIFCLEIGMRGGIPSPSGKATIVPAEITVAVTTGYDWHIFQWDHNPSSSSTDTLLEPCASYNHDYGGWWYVKRTRGRYQDLFIYVAMDAYDRTSGQIVVRAMRTCWWDNSHEDDVHYGIAHDTSDYLQYAAYIALHPAQGITGTLSVPPKIIHGYKNICDPLPQGGGAILIANWNKDGTFNVVK